MALTKKQTIKLRQADKTTVKRINRGGHYYVEVKADNKRVSLKRWRPSNNITNKTTKEEIHKVVSEDAFVSGTSRPKLPLVHSLVIEKRNSKTGSVAYWELRVYSEQETLTVEQMFDIAKEELSSQDYKRMKYYYDALHVEKGFPFTYNGGKTTTALDKAEFSVNLVKIDGSARTEGETF